MAGKRVSVYPTVCQEHLKSCRAWRMIVQRFSVVLIYGVSVSHFAVPSDMSNCDPPNDLGLRVLGTFFTSQLSHHCIFISEYFCFISPPKQTSLVSLFSLGPSTSRSSSFAPSFSIASLSHSSPPCASISLATLIPSSMFKSSVDEYFYVSFPSSQPLAPVSRICSFYPRGLVALRHTHISLLPRSIDIPWTAEVQAPT